MKTFDAKSKKIIYENIDIKFDIIIFPAPLIDNKWYLNILYFNSVKINRYTYINYACSQPPREARTPFTPLERPSPPLRDTDISSAQSSHISISSLSSSRLGTGAFKGPSLGWDLYVDM